jgi:hypothetical protein
MDGIIRLAADPTLRIRLIRKLVNRFPIGSFEMRLRVGAFERPWYAWCLYYAALQARALGHKAITALELGVAGGNGLLCLCRYRDQVERATAIKIVVLGLDAGTGLPQTSDFRDLLYCWPAGSFEMDYKKLKQQLGDRAELLLGDVGERAEKLCIRPDAPLGAIMFDLDLFTSTRDAFVIFRHSNLLPRVWCYFDDLYGYPDNAYSDRTGVRAAIRRFNAGEPETDTGRESYLSQAYVFRGHHPEEWHQQIYLYHRPEHPDYHRCLSPSRHTLDLESKEIR